jgi:eukaryotic translation initiation factor 2C
MHTNVVQQIEESKLRSMIVERLQAWQSNNRGALPATILWYRDGVSESQFGTISTAEIPQIRKAYAEAGGNERDLKVTFVVVGKRHHTRFYAAKHAQTYPSKEANRTFDNGNLKPGLLVEDVVTAPKPVNFFLQSHCALKGTARSAHYYVLHNDAGISNSDLQNLTLMLCYTFGRSTTGVSYAAPAYIADRLCERGRAYIREWAEDKFAVSVFNYKSYQDAQGQPRKPTNAEMAVEKTAMVRQLLTHKGFWGMYDDTGPKDKQRLNPWHPDLDDGMFWM